MRENSQIKFEISYILLDLRCYFVRLAVGNAWAVEIGSESEVFGPRAVGKPWSRIVLRAYPKCEKSQVKC
jgi:hypothetical protein